MTGISDSFNRPVNYFRISVTDRCNLRCIYCMPSNGVQLLDHSEILSYEEIATVTREAVALGIDRVRLTGGEPLVRGHISALVKMLSEIEGVGDLSLTTNGVLLARYAPELKSAGLKRVNISLDSLDPDKFESITRIGKLQQTLDGIEAARNAGLDPVKINMVVMRGINDDEIIDFARKTIDEGWHVRFIEFMPIAGGQQMADELFVSIDEMRRRIESLGRVEPHALAGNGPAKYFRLQPTATGTIGFISPVSEHFCFSCNRLRLTADGKLLNCLLADNEIDLRGPLRAGASGEDIRAILKQAIDSKPRGHNLKLGQTRQNRNMSQIGG